MIKVYDTHDMSNEIFVVMDSARELLRGDYEKRYDLDEDKPDLSILYRRLDERLTKDIVWG